MTSQRARRWRRARARARLLRRRMHANPVSHWVWCVVVACFGGVLLLAGVVMLFTPGPGIAGIVLGLAVLASEFSWAHGLLRRARHHAHQAAEKALEKQRERSRRRR